MAGKTPRLYLEHIREAIDLIDQYVGGRQRQDLDREPMLRQAIERNIEIVSEASRRLPAVMKTRHPEVPWRDIAAIGNILRHQYPAVNRDIIWRIVTQDVRPLATAVDACCSNPPRSKDVITARLVGRDPVPAARAGGRRRGVSPQPPCASISRCPCGCARSRWPASTTVTEAASSISAGPVTVCPQQIVRGRRPAPSSGAADEPHLAALLRRSAGRLAVAYPRQVRLGGAGDRGHRVVDDLDDLARDGEAEAGLVRGVERLPELLDRVVGEARRRRPAAPARSSGRDSASPAPRMTSMPLAVALRRELGRRASSTSVAMISRRRAPGRSGCEVSCGRALAVDAGIGHDEAIGRELAGMVGHDARAGCPSRASGRPACSGPAPPKAQSVKSRGSRPRSISTERSAPTMLLLAMRTMASAVSSAVLAERARRRPRRPRCARAGVERHARRRGNSPG